MDNLDEMQAFWLYENYAIGNGHKLVQLMEDTSVQLKFLRDKGLDEDTEL